MKNISSPLDGDLEFVLKYFSNYTSTFEIHMFFKHDGESGIEGDITLLKDLFDEATGKRIEEIFMKLVMSCVKDEDVPILSYNITPDSDKGLFCL